MSLDTTFKIPFTIDRDFWQKHTFLSFLPRLTESTLSQNVNVSHSFWTVLYDDGHQSTQRKGDSCLYGKIVLWDLIMTETCQYRGSITRLFPLPSNFIFLLEFNHPLLYYFSLVSFWKLTMFIFTPSRPFRTKITNHYVCRLYDSHTSSSSTLTDFPVTFFSE